jgi:pyrroline-5-carboxylate reductase
MNESELNRRIAFIGGGNMASSIIGGLVSSGWPADCIVASDPSPQQRKFLESSFEMNTFVDNKSAVEHAEIVVFSVKPQVMKQAIESVQSELVRGNPLIVSIAAGIRTSDALRWIGQDMAFIRVMPNTPALVNSGVSGLLANTITSSWQKQIASQIMEAVGQVVWVDNEEDIDTITGISGSGPAYFFKLMEIMIQTARSRGLSEEAARTLVLQTAMGAAKLAEHSEHEPGELRRRVTSPGGTTEAAILSMEKTGIDETIRGGIVAAIEKSDELAITLGRN